MRFVNSIRLKAAFLFLALTICLSSVYAQDNSPYSRYGLGDVVNNANILNRAMGGISAGFSNERYINQLNPATYAFIGQSLSKIPEYGKLISFEVGTEFNARTLVQNNPAGKYTSRNVYFNYMQLGMQLSKKGNWGAVFGLQPVTKESYKIETSKRLTGIDSLFTLYEGSGGAYQGYLGTGYRRGNLALGFNAGYTFGKKESTTNLRFINDTVDYYESSSNTRANFGSLFLNLGGMYNIYLDKDKKRSIKIGGYYNLAQRMRANEDVERLTYEVSAQPGNPNAGIDTIFSKTDRSGTIQYPSTFGVGFTYEKGESLLFGVDFTGSNWSNYSYFGQSEPVRNSWMVKSGLQFVPNIKSNKYLSKINYRAGFYYGIDHIRAALVDMPIYAFTFGFGLPTSKPAYNANFRSISPTVLNFAFEAGRRGGSNINLSENFVRIAMSVSLSDVWFFRRKYD
jgi:hypothetical protein